MSKRLKISYNQTMSVVTIMLLALTVFTPFVIVEATGDWYTLFGSFDLTDEFNGMINYKIIFIILFVAFAMMFIISLFIRNNIHRPLSLVGCVGQWVLFLFWDINLAMANPDIQYVGIPEIDFSSGVVEATVGFIIWLAADIVMIFILVSCWNWEKKS